MGGQTGGQTEHAHSFSVTTKTSKDGAHIHMLASGGKVTVDEGNWGMVGLLDGYIQSFEAGGRDLVQVPRARAVTDKDGVHDHMISSQADSDMTTSLPPYLDVVYCIKD